MGGTVAVTLRTSDGTEYRMRRWTNPLPWAITNLRFIEEDPDHIEAMLEQWKAMVADYEKNKGNIDPATGEPAFEFPMTSAYVTEERLLAPYGYGLVVVDMVNKVIAHSQGYTAFGEFFPARFGGEDPEDPDSDFHRFKALFDAGRAKMFQWLKKDRPPPVPSPWPSAEAVLEDYEDFEGGRKCLDGVYLIDMSPYTVERFPESADGFRALRQRVLDLGFVLTEADERAWAEAIQWQEENRA